MSRMQLGASKFGVTTRMRLTLSAVAFLISVLVVFKVPESSMIMASWPVRFLQFETNSHDIAGLVLQYREWLLQNVSTQLLSKNEWSSFGVRARQAFRCQPKYVLIASALDVSVIVPTLNEEKYLPKCLASLVNQPVEEEFEVIVVDGGSTDRTSDIAREFADKVLVRPMAPVGAARNHGAKEAKGDILAFIDADTMPCEGWLRTINERFESEDTTVGLTGPTLPYDGCVVDSITYRLWTVYLQRLLLSLGMPHVIGFNCAYRREPFLRVGGFHENWVMSEDILLAQKIRMHGSISFDSRMVAMTSARRFKRYGSSYMTGLYLLNGLSTLLLKRSYSNYPPVR